MTDQTLTQWRAQRAASRAAWRSRQARRALARAQAWAAAARRSAGLLAASRPHRFAPAAGGAALVSWGAAQVYSPAGWILGGIFLLIYDART